MILMTSSESSFLLHTASQFHSLPYFQIIFETLHLNIQEEDPFHQTFESNCSEIVKCCSNKEYDPNKKVRNE
jgi:hypothetical protein